MARKHLGVPSFQAGLLRTFSTRPSAAHVYTPLVRELATWQEQHPRRELPRGDGRLEGPARQHVRLAGAGARRCTRSGASRQLEHGVP